MTIKIPFDDLSIESYFNLINDLRKSKNDYVVYCEGILDNLRDFCDSKEIIITKEHKAFYYDRALLEYLKIREHIDSSAIENYIFSNFHSSLVQKLLKKIRKLNKLKSKKLL